MSNVPDFEFVRLTPDWIEALPHSLYSQSASILIDRWLWYVSQEFEGLKP